MAQSLDQNIYENVETTHQNEYPYQTLPDSSIRLFEILPDPETGEIRFRLYTHQIDQCPPYTALSYTWGPEYPQVTTVVDEMPFNIRANLYNFLNMTINKHLNARRPIPLYWIDQICIDQSNISERNEQIKLMHAIYSRAELVTIWLGEAAEDSDTAMKFLRGSRVALFARISDRQWDKCCEFTLKSNCLSTMPVRPSGAFQKRILGAYVDPAGGVLRPQLCGLLWLSKYHMGAGLSLHEIDVHQV